MELADLYRGELSYRRLRVLIERLPMESATRTALRDTAPEVEAEPVEEAAQEEEGPVQFGPWSLINYQIAALTDAVRVAAYYSAAAVTKNPPPPKPTPRPGMRPLRRISRAMAERLARLHPTEPD